jgi:hypothetical protein
MVAANARVCTVMVGHLRIGRFSEATLRTGGRPTVSVLRRRSSSKFAMGNPPMAMNPVWSYVKRVPPAQAPARGILPGVVQGIGSRASSTMT